jgi:hypothetical protein
MPSTDTTRRRVLAVGGLLATAALGGCSRTLAGADDDPSRRLVLSLSPLDGPLRHRHVVDLTETGPPWDEAAFNATLDGSTYTTQHHPPFPLREDDERTYARRNGTYYHLDSLLVGEETVERPILRLYEVGRTDELDDAPEHVSQSSLPKADQRAVKIAYFVARARDDGGGVPWGLVERGGYVYRNEEAIAASALLAESEPSHVEYREAIYEVRVARETFHEPIYRADVDPVADSKSEMEAILRASLLDARVSREELSVDERDVLLRARRDSHGESHPYSDAFASLLKKLGERAYLDGDVENDSGVHSGPIPRRRRLLYDDRYYTYTLEFVTE